MTGEEGSLLYDFYGSLLSERQREVFGLYHEENLSLSEIAEEIGVSRQAVHNSIGKAREELEGFEKKLELVARHKAHEKAVGEALTRLDGILKDKERLEAMGEDTAKDLRRIKKLIKGLDV